MFLGTRAIDPATIAQDGRKRGPGIAGVLSVTAVLIGQAPPRGRIGVARRRCHRLAPAGHRALGRPQGAQHVRKVDVPVLGIVENMSYFLCPHCGGRSEIFSHGRARQEAERLGTEFLGEVPLDVRIGETSDGGTPITVAEPDNPHAQVFREMAPRIWEKVSGAHSARRAPPRIVIE